jgi:hypothetical protein
MTARVPHTGRSSVDNRREVWDIMSNNCGKNSCFVYIKPSLRTRNGRDDYMLLFYHFIGPNNVGNMASEAETKLTGTLYNGEISVSPGKLMSGFTLNNIHSSMD